MTDTVSRGIVESVTQVGHTMNLKIVAEYVENDKIMAVLRSMGVDYGQGYGISRPMPIEEMIAPHIRKKKVVEAEAQAAPVSNTAKSNLVYRGQRVSQ